MSMYSGCCVVLMSAPFDFLVYKRNWENTYIEYLHLLNEKTSPSYSLTLRLIYDIQTIEIFPFPFSITQLLKDLTTNSRNEGGVLITTKREWTAKAKPGIDTVKSSGSNSKYRTTSLF